MHPDDPPTPSTIHPVNLPYYAQSELPKVGPNTSVNSASRSETTRAQDKRVLQAAELQVSEATTHGRHSLGHERSRQDEAERESDNDHGSDHGSVKDERRRLRRRRSTFEGSDVFAHSSVRTINTQPLRSKKDKTNTLGRFLRRVHDSNILVRHFTYIIPVAVVILVPLLVGAIAYQSASVGGVKLMWFSIWLMIVWLTLWAARFIASIIPGFLAVVSTTFTKNRKKWRNMGKQIELAATLFLWWLAIEISFIPTMSNHHLDGDRGVRPWERTMNKILLSLMIGTLLNFIEKIIIQLIAMSFHLRTYQDRIELNKVQITALTRLYSRSKDILAIGDGEFNPDAFSAASSVTEIGETEESPLRSSSQSPRIREKTNSKRFSVNPAGVLKPYPLGSPRQSPSNSDLSRSPGRLVKDAQIALNQVGNRLGHVAENMATKVAKDFSGSKKESKNDRDVVIALLQSTETSLSLARQLFRTYADKEAEIVRRDGFQAVFETEDEADAAFLIFDKDLNGDISMAELEAVCVEIGLERKAITDSLKDLDSVISKLDHVLVFIVVVITILVFVSLISSGAATVITSAGSTVLALSWLFSATAQEFLQSIVFVFVKHPFDVGDRVTVYGNTGLEGKGDDYYVKKISLLYTEFRKLEGHIVQAPNSYLNTLFILNQRRSGGLAEAVSLVIKFGTTLEQIENLREHLLAFVKEEKREYQSKILTELKEVTQAHSLKLNVVFFYKSNWQNELLRLYRRNKFICKLMVTMQELEIEGPRMRYPGQKQSFPLYIQQALHSIPPPQEGHWGTPDQPRGFVSSDPKEAQERARAAAKVVPASGSVSGPTGVEPAGRTSVEDEAVVDADAEAEARAGPSSGAGGEHHPVGRMPSQQSAFSRPRANTSVSATSKPQDFSLGMEAMAGEHWPGDVYDNQDEERLRRILSGMTRTRHSVKKRPSRDQNRDRDWGVHRTRSTHGSVQTRAVSQSGQSSDIGDGAGGRARGGSVSAGLPGFSGDFQLHRTLTDSQSHSRWKLPRKLMSLRRGSGGSARSSGSGGGGGGGSLLGPGGRYRPGDVEQGGMTPIPESLASRRNSAMKVFQHSGPGPVRSGPMPDAGAGTGDLGLGIDGGGIEMADRTPIGGRGDGGDGDGGGVGLMSAATWDQLASSTGEGGATTPRRAATDLR